MTRGVDEANPVRRIFEKLPARLLRLQEALLALDAEILLNAATTRDKLDELCRSVCVELVGDEDPARVGIGVDGLVYVADEVFLGSGRSDRWADHFASHHVEVRDQRQGAMADVLELDTFNEAGAHRFRFMQAFERLHARLLVGADHVHALRRELRSVAVRVANLLDVFLVLLGRFALILRCQPILALVRSQVRLAKKRSTCRGEMLLTILRLMASRANSGGVQWETGKPLSAGGSQASAMIDATSSGLNFGGVPLR